MTPFGTRLAAARRARGYTQQQLCQMAELSFMSVSKMERGVFNPRLDTITRLAKVLDVPAGWLISGDVDQVPRSSRAKWLNGAA